MDMTGNSTKELGLERMITIKDSFDLNTDKYV